MRRRLLLLACALRALFVSRPALSSEEPKPSATPAPKKFALPDEAIRDLVPMFGGAIATDRIVIDAQKVGYMYREKPVNPQDTGWRFFAGDEDQAYLDDRGHSGIYAVNTVANYDPDIIPYVATAAPCAFEKIPGTKTYRRVE